MELAVRRGLNATYCPSEVARTLKPDSWRDIMGTVREVADGLVEIGALEVLQKGKIIEGKATEAKGPIRLRLR